MTASAKDVELVGRRSGSDLYVIAVRRGGATSNVRFTGLPDRLDGTPIGTGDALRVRPGATTAAHSVRRAATAAYQRVGRIVQRLVRASRRPRLPLRSLGACALPRRVEWPSGASEGLRPKASDADRFDRCPPREVRDPGTELRHCGGSVRPRLGCPADRRGPSHAAIDLAPVASARPKRSAPPKPTARQAAATVCTRGTSDTQAAAARRVRRISRRR